MNDSIRYNSEYLFLQEMANTELNAYPGQPRDGASYPASGGVSVYNPSVPFVQNIGSLYPNKMIFISGIPNPDPGRITINLDTEDYHAFHFDVRFNYGDSTNTIVRNTKDGDGWGNEERDTPYFPFEPDMFFEMMILVHPYCFKVAVNNQHVVEYYHRVQPLNSIDTLNIKGDVLLAQIRIQG